MLGEKPENKKNQSNKCLAGIGESRMSIANQAPSHSPAADLVSHLEEPA